MQDRIGLNLPSIVIPAHAGIPMTLMGLRRSSYAKLWLCYGGQVAGVTNEGKVRFTCQ